MSDSTSEKSAEKHDFRDAARDRASHAAENARQFTSDAAQHYVREPAQDFLSLAKDYAREKPDVAAMWCFALGIIVGWKLKP